MNKERKLLITSPQNPRVKDAVRLRDRPHREKQERILIDGARELHCALGAGVRLLEAFVCEPLCNRDEAQHLLTALIPVAARCCTSASQFFRSWRSASGRKACSAWPKCHGLRCRPLAVPENAIVAVLEGVEKPGNVGPCSAAPTPPECRPFIMADGRTDLYNPNAIRASLGTIFHAAGLRSHEQRCTDVAARTQVPHSRRPGGWLDSLCPGRLSRPNSHRARQ